MIVGVPKEIKLQEHRIGLTPDSVKKLSNKGHEVLIQNNGGFEAGFSNEDYKNAGATIIEKPEEIILSDPAALIVDQIQMIPCQIDHSRGRSSDGGATWSLFTNPSPNAANSLPSSASKSATSLYPCARNWLE